MTRVAGKELMLTMIHHFKTVAENMLAFKIKTELDIQASLSEDMGTSLIVSNFANILQEIMDRASGMVPGLKEDIKHLEEKIAELESRKTATTIGLGIEEIIRQIMRHTLVWGKK